jgi:RNA polymerase sporulation-specific sigma factor
MKSSKSIHQYKKEITKKFTKYSNEELVNMLNEGKRDEVIQSLLPLVIYVVDKFKYVNEFEELICVGNEGLMRGIDTFNPDKGDNVISYCQSIVRYSILDYLTIHKNFIKTPSTKYVSKKTELSRPKMVDLDDLSRLDYEDEEYKEVTINRRELEDLLMTIPKMKYSKVMLFLDYYLIPGMTYSKVSEKNGFTKQNSSLIILDMLKKIKENPQLMERFREILLP